MKVLRGIFVFVAFASAIFFACSYEKENPCAEDPGSDACKVFQCALAEEPDACIADISSDSSNNEHSSDSGNNEHSSDSGNNEHSSDSGNNEYSSDSGNPGTSSSSQASGSNSSSSNATSTSSSSRSSAATSPSSSSVASTPSSSSNNNNNGGAPSNCAFRSSWCGDIEFGDVVKTSQNNGTGVLACVYATAITMLGNSNGRISVNGTEINNCGNTGWGQQTCANTVQSIAKADGGYYIYAPNWYADFTTTGGTPACSGGTPASSSSRASSSSVGGTPQSSSSAAGTPTLTCGAVPSTGTANVPITSRPSVQCNNSTVPGANITWASSPVNINWDSPAANTYTNIRATVTSGTCNGRTATCSGNLTVSAPTITPSSSSQGGGGGGSCETCVPSSQLSGNAPTTRYWDSCKPSCAWPGKQTNGQGTAKACNINGGTLSDANAVNACQNGPSFACMNQAPWSISDNISYGFAAAHTDADCGKCFQLEFTSNGEGGNSGSITGKTFVVMVNNIGDIRAGAAFDLMIPGGGVGDFDALSRQVQNNGVSNFQPGVRYGGFRGQCGNDVTCIRNMCSSAFSSSALADLKRGCDWYVDWMKIANNPTVKYKEINCPAALKAKW